MERSKAKRRSAGLLNPSNITRIRSAVVASAPCLKTRISSEENQPPNRHAERGVSALMTGRSPLRKTMAGKRP